MRLALMLVAAFAVLTVAVAADALRPVDRYAIHHVMPFADDSVAATIAPSEPLNAIRPILRGHRSVAQSIGALAFAPADTISALLLATGATTLIRRRGRPWRAGGLWTAAGRAGDRLRPCRHASRISAGRPTIHPPCTCASAPNSRRTGPAPPRPGWRPATGFGSWTGTARDGMSTAR